MSNPVLVEVLRGALVESRHAGAVAVVDADGGRVLALGDAEQPVYPRSAVKALQALPLIESGAADRFGLDPEALALACASHSGSPATSRRQRGCWRSRGWTRVRSNAVRTGRSTSFRRRRWRAPAAW